MNGRDPLLVSREPRLTQALEEVAAFHPPEIVAALFDGARHRSGEVAVHFAAMLFHLHGKSDEPFDWGHREFFLRFVPNGGKRHSASFAP